MLKKLPFVTRTYGLFNSKVRRCKKATSLAAGLAMTGLLAMNLPAPVQAQELVPGLEQTGGQNPFGLPEFINEYVYDHTFADVDQDGDSDLILIDDFSEAYIQININSGTPQSPDFGYTNDKGPAPNRRFVNLNNNGPVLSTSVDAADFDGDTYPEIGVFLQVEGDSFSSGTLIRVFNNNGSGDFDSSDYFDIPTPSFLQNFDYGDRVNDEVYISLEFADLDGDYDQDAVLSLMGGTYEDSFGELGFVVIQNTGDTSVPAFSSLSTSYGLPGIDTSFPGYGSPAHLELIDLDNDGDLDALLQLVNFDRAPKAELLTYENDGDPYSPSFVRDDNFFNTDDVGDFYLFNPPSSFASVDFDGDGEFEFILPRFTRGSGYVIKSSSVAKFGSGNSNDKLPGGYISYWAAFENTLVDPNEDNGGLNYRMAEFELVLRTGPYQPYGLNSESVRYDYIPAFEVVDFDSDGDYDIAFKDSYSTNTITIQYNNGDANNASFYGGTVSLLFPTSVYNSIDEFEIVDIDKDGDLDFAFITQAPYIKSDKIAPPSFSVSFFEADGSPLGFEFPPFIELNNLDPFGPYTPGIEFVDIDSDGDQDFVISITTFDPDKAPGGSAYTSVYLYENFGDANNPSFFSTDVIKGTNGFPTAGVQLLSDPRILFGTPSFADLDIDGDLDLVMTGYTYSSGSPALSTTQFRNVGDRTNPQFEEVNNELFDSSDIELPNLSLKQVFNLVPNNSSEFADIDGDNDADLITIVQDGSGFYLHQNVADNTKYPEFIDEEYIVGTEDILSEFEYSNGVYFNDYSIRDINLVDIDADGDLDLIAHTEYAYDLYNKSAKGYGLIDEFRNTMMLFENTGNAVDFAFDRSGITLGYRSGTIDWDFINPAFSDVDADGDLDLVFTLYRYDRAQTRYFGPGFYYIPNEGSATSPSFSLVNEQEFGNGISPIAEYSQSAAFGDFNGDSSIDALFELYQDYGYTYLGLAYSTREPYFRMISYDNRGYYDDSHYTFLTPFDMDCDGDLDLVEEGIFDDDIFYIHFNDGSKTSLNVYDTPYYERYLTVYEDEFTIGDLDGDGDPDVLMLAENGSLYLLENTSGDVDYTDPEGPTYNPEFEYGYLPNFSEIGPSGLFDITNWNADGLNDITALLRNSSLPYDGIDSFFNDGSPTSPYFNFASFTTSFDRLITDEYVEVFSSADIDKDGDLDVLVTRQYGIYIFENYGTAESADFNTTPSASPQLGELVLPFPNTAVSSFPQFVDIDADGDYDVVTSYFYFDFPYIVGGFVSVENTGSATSPEFDLSGPNFGFGINEYFYGTVPFLPEFIDFDRDGDLDFVAASFDYFNPAGPIQSWIVGENVGDAVNPDFEILETNNFYGIPIDFLSSIVKGGNRNEVLAVSFGDLNSDGDLDAILSTEENGIFFENTREADPIPYFAPGVENEIGIVLSGGKSNSSTGSASDIVNVSNEEKGFRNTYAITKEFVDIDADGDQDLLRAVGSYYTRDYNNAQMYSKGGPANPVTIGYVDIYNNYGDAVSGNFAPFSSDSVNLIINNNYVTDGYYEAYNYYVENYIVSLTAEDIDLDGDQDLFVSVRQYLTAASIPSTTRSNEVRSFFFENTGTPTSPSFYYGQEILRSNYDYSIVDLADVSGDGRPDIVTTRATGDYGRLPGYDTSINVFINYSSPVSPYSSTIGDALGGRVSYFTDRYASGTVYYDGLANFSAQGKLVDLDRDGDYDLVMSRTGIYYDRYYDKGGPGGYPLYFRNEVFEVLENVSNRNYIKGGPTEDIDFARTDLATEFLNNIPEDYSIRGDIGVVDIDGDSEFEIIADNVGKTVRTKLPGSPYDIPAIIFDGNYFPGPQDPDDKPEYDPYFEEDYLPTLSYYDPAGGAQFVDLNRDGRLDIANDGSRSIFGIYNDGYSTASPFFDFEVPDYFYESLYVGEIDTRGFFEYGVFTSGDIDGDGDVDFFGFYDGYFVHFENEGSATRPYFEYYNYQPFGLTITGRNFGAPSLVDMDADGDLDMVFSATQEYEKGSGSRYSTLYAYENTGDATNPAFAPRNDNFRLTIVGENFGSQFALGRTEFIDFDRDGDLDVVIPAFEFDGVYEYTFLVGENVGSATNPQFDFSATDNFYGLTPIVETYIYDRRKGGNTGPGPGGGYYEYPVASISFGDIDGDGDNDALTGGGVVVFHENDAPTLPIPYIAEGVENQYGLGFYLGNYRKDDADKLPGGPGGYAEPPFAQAKELTDIDGDGDLDFLRAQTVPDFIIDTKQISFYQTLGVLKIETNTGDANDPVFGVDSDYTTHALQTSYSIQPGKNADKLPTGPGFRYIRSLSTADIDFDGDQDLFVSVEVYDYDFQVKGTDKLPFGDVSINNYFFENTGDRNNPAFAVGESLDIFDYGFKGIGPSDSFVIIDLGDTDGDGDYDMLVGENFYSYRPGGFDISFLAIIPGEFFDYFEDKGAEYTTGQYFQFGNQYNVYDAPPYYIFHGGGDLVDLDQDGDLDLVMGRTSYNYVLDKLPGGSYYDYKSIEVLENTRLPYSGSGPLKGEPSGPSNRTEFVRNLDAVSYLPYYDLNSISYITVGDVVAGDLDRDGDIEFVMDQLPYFRTKGNAPTGPTGPGFFPAIIFDGDYFPGNIDDDTPPYVSDPYDVADKSAEPYQYFYWDSPYDPESDISELVLEIADTDDFSNIVQSVDVTNLTQIGIELDEGPNFARLVATNGAGLTSTSGSTDGVFIDSQQVIVTLDGAPIVTNNPNPTFTGTFMDPDPSSGMNSIEFRSKGNGLPPAMFQASFDNTETSSTWSGTQQIALPVEGVYDFQFRGIDCAFNRQFTILEGAVIYDLTPPFVNDFRFVEIVNGGFARTSLTVELEYFDNLSDVTGFDPTDPSDLIITGPGGNLYPMPILPGPDLFTFTIDPTIDGVEGEYTLRVPAGAAQDGAGNLSGPSQVLSFTYDVTPPELLCDAAFNTLGGVRQSGSRIFVTAEFTEPVIGFVPGAVSVSGAASFVGITPMPGPDTTYVIELDALSTGTATVSLNDGFITDLAGNEFDATGVSTTFEIIPTPDMLPDPAPLFASDGAANDRYGQSVDLDGSVAIVGASGVGTVGAAYVLQATDPTTFTEVAKITSDDGATGDNFGMSVGISGDWAIVGAPNDDDNDDSTGSVYFFKREVDDTPDPTKGLDPFIGEIWNQADKVLASDFPTATDERLGRFGQVVDIDGQTAVVGRPLDSRGGSVFVLELDICDGELGTWVPVQQLVPSDLTTRDNFGHSVAILGDVLVVGSRRDDDRGSDTGSVYIFRRNGGVWSQEQKIVPGDADRLDQIGTSVSRYANTIAFGSPGDDDLGSGAGAGYIYGNAVGGSWTVVDKLTTTFADTGSGFGTTIAHTGSNAALGAPFSDLINRDAGLIVNFSGDISGAVKLLPAKPGIPFTETPIIFSESMGRNDRAGSELAIDDSEIGRAHV